MKPVTVKTNLPIPALTLVKFRRTHVAVPLDPTAAPDYPLQDGVTLVAAHDGQVEIADYYGGKYEVPGASFTPGHLYAGAGGLLTQDAALAAATGWMICVGWAATATEFTYEPHVPMRVLSTI
jgi:hypothetical protein